MNIIKIIKANLNHSLINEYKKEQYKNELSPNEKIFFLFESNLLNINGVARHCDEEQKN